MPMLEMRTSERHDLKHCAQKWYWSTVEQLEPNRSANPLWFGSAVHEGLAAWYQKGHMRGPHPAETFSAFLDGERKMIVTNEDEEKEYVDARELGVDMLNRYVELYGNDDDWDVLVTEQTAQVRISKPEMELMGVKFPAQKNWLRYVMTFDGVFRKESTGELWLMEHKTAASIRVDHLSLDDQAGSYWALATLVLRKRGVIGPKEEISGIEYNFLRKALGDTRPMNEDGLRTNKPTKQHYLDALEPFYELTDKETVATLEELAQDVNEQAYAQGGEFKVLGDVSASQPPAYFERFPVYRSRSERRKMIQRIQDEAVFKEAYTNGWLPVTKAPDKMMCGYCQFKRMCELDEQGDTASVEEFKASQYHTRDLYEAHRKKSAE